jgi:molecular chaperone GrpE
MESGQNEADKVEANNMDQTKQGSDNPAATDGDDRLVADPSDPTVDAATDQAAVLQNALAAAEAKAAEYYDALLRAKAETDNARRRAQEDVAKAHKFGIENFAEAMLPVMDSLQAALADSTGDIGKLREGVELTRKQLLGALERNRLVAIDPVGEKFDPHRHQAISTVPAPAGTAPNHVVNVLQQGWTLADRVLRPALVTVSS